MLLGEIADFEMGQAPPGTECNFEGRGTLFVKAGEFGSPYPIEREWTTKPLKHGKAGDVFICVVGATAGKLNLGIDCAIGRSVAAIRPKSKLDTKFLYYQLLPKVLKLRASSAGSAQGVISKKQLAEIAVTVPEVAEQLQIVAEIEKQFSRLDEAIANLNRVKANLKRYKAAVLKAAVEGRLVPTDGNWKAVVLGDIALSIRNGYSSKPTAESGTPILRISAVRPMALDVADVRYLSGALKEYESFLILPGDVLFTRCNGNRDYVGVCACVPSGIGPTVYPDKLIRVRVPNSTLLPEFLVIAASTGCARAFLESKIRTTAGQSGISGSDLKAIPLELPSTVEQRRIVAEVDLRFTLIRGVEGQVDANLKRAERMRQAVLQTAFTASPDARQ